MLLLVVTAATGETATIHSQTALPAADSSTVFKLSEVDTAAGFMPKPAADLSKIAFAGRSDSTLSPAGPIQAKDTGQSAAKQAATPNEKQKMKLLKRKYNGRQQVLLAVFMMIFVVGIVTMAQQWNPR